MGSQAKGPGKYISLSYYIPSCFTHSVIDVHELISFNTKYTMYLKYQSSHEFWDICRKKYPSIETNPHGKSFLEFWSKTVGAF